MQPVDHVEAGQDIGLMLRLYASFLRGPFRLEHNLTTSDRTRFNSLFCDACRLL